KDSMLITISNQIPSGIHAPDALGNNTFSLYPNPNKGIFTLEGAAAPGNYTISITNILGQELYQQRAKVSRDKLHVELNGGELAAGTYYLVVAKDGERVAMKKFSKVQ